jgi:hypothetical protein
MQKSRPKSPTRTHQGLSYRSLQQQNSLDRRKLLPEQQKWLKQNGYRNVGWDAIIQLHEKIADLFAQNELANSSLEELFLEADRIGNKYQTATEIEQFQQAMAEEANAIADVIDQQFPQTELEMIDFSQSIPGQKPIKGKRSNYQNRTAKLSI